MTKEQLILLLKNYKENRAKLKLKLRDKESILRQLENLNNIAISAVNYENNSDIHSKNSISNKTGNEAIKNADKESELKEQLQKIEEEIFVLTNNLEEVNIRLEALKYKEREILVAYYIDGCTYEDIGNRVYYRLFNQTRTSRHIQRLVEDTTKKILGLRLKMS